jgi:hypothetical protein
MNVHLPYNTILGNIQGIEYYEYYDGPKAFLVTNGETDFLAYWCDFTENGEGFLYAPIDAETLSQLKRNDIDYTEALMNPVGDYVYYVSPGGRETIVRKMHVTEVPNDFYPLHGFYVEYVTMWDND